MSLQVRRGDIGRLEVKTPLIGTVNDAVSKRGRPLRAGLSAKRKPLTGLPPPGRPSLTRYGCPAMRVPGHPVASAGAIESESADRFAVTG